MLLSRTQEGKEVLSFRRTTAYPEEWGKLHLTQFLDAMESAAISTFANARPELELFIQIDEALYSQAQTLLHEPTRDELEVAMLTARLFSIQRAAARLVMAGQQYEARALMRAAVECAVYAWALAHNAELRQVWVKRDEGAAQRSAARNAFQWNGLMKLLEAADAQLVAVVRAQYEELIDLGAHPNVGGVAAHAEVGRKADGTPILFTAVGGASQDQLTANLAEITKVSRATYALIKLTMPARLDKSGIAAKLDVLLAS